MLLFGDANKGGDLFGSISYIYNLHNQILEHIGNTRIWVRADISGVEPRFQYNLAHNRHK